MREQIVEARNLTKTYADAKALQNISVSVKRGDIYGLVGDNGAGKTTFLKLLTGQIYPTSGEIMIFGEHLPKELERRRRQTGAIVEEPGFYPRLSVEKNLEYYRVQKGIPGKEKVGQILQTVGLETKRKSKCSGLSLGMKQRLGLAIALMGEPELLILDEPINGLDPTGIIEFRRLLQRLNQEKNITIILSSHILPELEQIAGVYGFLSGGRLLEQISADALKERCSAYLEISVSEPEKYTALLERELQEKNYQVLPDQSIRIRNPHRSTMDYSRLASSHQIDILRLEKKQASLEDYYIKLKNRGAQEC